MVKAIILVKSPKKLIAARLQKIDNVLKSFPVSGQFDAVVIIDINELSNIKQITNQIQEVSAVERTETMVEIQ